ncbi:hypothetical protein BH09PSE1_BH09PSE1_23360 [soil metagenome]
MSAARKPRIVRASELGRVLAILDARGEHPAAYTLLPGGAIRLHTSEPDAANDVGETEAERAAWDAVLAK